MTLYYALSSNKLNSTAVMLGIANPLEGVYPFIYASSLIAVLAEEEQTGVRSGGEAQSLFSSAKKLVNRKSIRLALLSFGNVHGAQCCDVYHVRGISIGSNLGTEKQFRWGYPFVYETYLYHLHRLDHRHNFSPYWLPIYLSYRGPSRIPTAIPRPFVYNGEGGPDCALGGGLSALRWRLSSLR